MNEETLNTIISVNGNRHVGGFIVLERMNRHLWRAYDWSAFFVCMLLSTGSCRYYLDDEGHAISALSDLHVMQLTDCLDTTGEQTPDKMVFIIPSSLVIGEPIYARWKNNLPAESKSQSNELQSISRG